MSGVHSCGGCTETWTAMGAAHCGACHRTFFTVRSFDDHRVGPDSARRCVIDPQKHALNQWGYWGRPDGERPPHWDTGDGKRHRG